MAHWIATGRPLAQGKGWDINAMPADALASKVIRASAGCVGQITCFFAPKLISSIWVKPNPRYDSKYEYVFDYL